MARRGTARGWCSGTVCLSTALVLSWIAFIIYYTSRRHAATVEPAGNSGKLSKRVSEGGKLAARAQETSAVGQVERRDESDYGNLTSIDIHVVFSTDCSEYQDWQSILLFYSAMAAGQPGYVTRIASGCDDSKRPKLTRLYKELFSDSIGGDRFNVHFTPDFKKDNATKKTYDFYNKPRGLQHFLKNYQQSVLSGSVAIALIDPDMVFTRRLLPYVRGHADLLFDTKRQTILDAPVAVARGTPVAQQYGLGAPWTNDNHRWFNRGKICGERSRCLLFTEKFSLLHFSVGPPYLVHVSDMRALADTWAEFVTRVYKKYPHLLAEMYAYSMAAAHLGLPHFQAHHFMASNVDAAGEGWAHIDALGDDVCNPVRKYERRKLPILLHYCQSFRVGDFGWTKRQVPKDIFSCNNSAKLLLPHKEIYKSDYRIKDKKKVKFSKDYQSRRNTFMLCSLYHMLNDAIKFFTKKMCGDRDVDSFTPFNLQDRMT